MLQTVLPSATTINVTTRSTLLTEMMLFADQWMTRLRTSMPIFVEAFKKIINVRLWNVTVAEAFEITVTTWTFMEVILNFADH